MISKKHPLPTHEDNSVIDWTFESTWATDPVEIHFELKESLDEVFRKLCMAVSGEKVGLRIDINQLFTTKNSKNKIPPLCYVKQINKKGELNLELIRL